MDDRFMLIDASNKIICEGQVKEFYRGEAVFKVENGLDSLRDMQKGQWMRFTFLSGRRGVFEGVLATINGTELIIEDIHSLANIVKEDVRINTDFPTKLYQKGEDGRIYAWNAIVADISAGGVKVLSEAPLPLNEVMEVAIPCYSWYIVVEVVFIREIMNRSETERHYSYGGKFHNLVNTEENLIRSMVFQTAARKAGKMGGRIKK